MKLRALEIPDDPARLAVWLDEQLASPHLTEFVTELLAIHNLPLKAPERVAIDTWLGATRDSFLQNGSGMLSPTQRQELLTKPWMLLDLQEQIDIAGGRYWQEVADRSTETSPAIARVRDQLQTFLTTTAAPGESAEVSRATPTTSSVATRRPFVRAVVGVAAMAAALLLAFIAFRPSAPNTVAWGWNEKDLLNEKLTPSQYLNRLADAGDKWFKKRPESKADVTKRLSEMQQGCQRLIAAEHKPLADEDRQWLVEKCKAWSKKFDEQLAALEKGDSPIAVRDEVDKIVNKLVETLKARASERV